MEDETVSDKEAVTETAAETGNRSAAASLPELLKSSQQAPGRKKNVWKHGRQEKKESTKRIRNAENEKNKYSGKHEEN